MRVVQSKPEIFVRFVAAGFHCWPEAPEHRAYLSQLHRHLFHVEVRMHVEHHDREVEFHDLGDVAQEMFHKAAVDLGRRRSCEDMAAFVGAQLAYRFMRSTTVTVSEDGECGATVVSTIDNGVNDAEPEIKF